MNGFTSSTNWRFKILLHTQEVCYGLQIRSIVEWKTAPGALLSRNQCEFFYVPVWSRRRQVQRLNVTAQFAIPCYLLLLFSSCEAEYCWSQVNPFPLDTEDNDSIRNVFFSTNKTLVFLTTGLLFDTKRTTEMAQYGRHLITITKVDICMFWFDVNLVVF